jgi:antitoxin MazE
MTQAILDIRYWGNSLGLRLPAAIAREAHIHADQSVRVSVEAGRIMVSPIFDQPMTLKQRLAQFDPHRHGGEVMASERLGTEVW